MIRHEHHAARLVATNAIGPLDRTRERDIRRRKRRLPHAIKLPQQIRHLIRVEIVINERDHAFVLQDHFPEGGPVLEPHGVRGWLVDVVEKPRVGDGLDELGGRDGRVAVGVLVAPVVVAEDDGDDLERVAF